MKRMSIEKTEKQQGEEIEQFTFSDLYYDVLGPRGQGSGKIYQTNLLLNCLWKGRYTK